MPEPETYVTRAEFEENAAEMRRNFNGLREEIRAFKDWKNWTVGIAAAIGSSIAYALMNFIHEGVHF